MYSDPTTSFALVGALQAGIRNELTKDDCLFNRGARSRWHRELSLTFTSKVLTLDK